MASAGEARAGRPAVGGVGVDGGKKTQKARFQQMIVCSVDRSGHQKLGAPLILSPGIELRFPQGVGRKTFWFALFSFLRVVFKNINFLSNTVMRT